MNDQTERRPRWSPVDRWLAAALLVCGAAIGALYVRAFDASGQRTSIDFGQYEFAAAVALACGHGFIDVGPGVSPVLDDFLAIKIDRMSCAALPNALPARAPDFTQRIYRYFMYSVALVWKAGGVSWSVLWPLFALFYAATVALAYGIFRLAVGRAGSAVAAAALLGSALHLQHLPFLRDYTKAPFILALLLLTAYTVKSAARPKAMVGWSVAFGFVLGLGFGFRNDMMIVMPPFVVAVLLWTPPGDARSWGVRFACLAAAAATFAIVAWPIVSGYRQGSNSGHVAVLGLVPAFEQPLGISPSVYEWGYLYLDRLVDATITSHAWRTGGRAVEYLSAEYDREAVRYLLEVARHWPADILVRAYASVLKIIDFPFTVGMYASGTPAAFMGSVARAFYERQQVLLHVLQRTGVPLVAASLAVVSARSVSRALLLLVALIYFAGYPAIQFQLRHFFHLEFIGWWALVFVAERLIRAGATAVRGAGVPDWGRVRPATIRVATFEAITLALVFLPLTVARAYQQPHVRALVRAYDAAPRMPVALEQRPRGDITLMAMPALWDGQESGTRVRAKYLVAEFSPACGVVRLPVTFRSEPAEPTLDFSYPTIVDLSRGATTIFFPAYETDQGSRFEGIEIPREHESCLTRVMRVTDLRPFPQLLVLRLAGQWDEAPMYQTLTRWERQPIASAPEQRVVTLPRRLPVTRSVLKATLDSLPPITVRVPLVHDDLRAQWIVHGTPDGPNANLLRLAPQHRTPADRFVVEGEVRRGGLTVGLLRGDAWAGDTNVTVTTPGAFAVVLAPSSADDYGVLLTNADDDSWVLRNAPARLLRLAGRLYTLIDIRILRAGWIK